MKSVLKIGKGKEHLRLNVEDEEGQTQSIFWWGGAGGELPEAESKFDIAYSLRASSYRGRKQVTLGFKEFRAAEEKPVEVRKPKIEILDLRLEVGRFENLKVGMLVWAEGADKLKGKSRFELQQADEFAIYTNPPSPADLRKVLMLVKPKTIYVFGVPPAEEKAEDFLNRLAGLCKYTLNNYNGQTTLPKLTSAMASRASAVQFGLQWLAAGGQLSLNIEDDKVGLSAEKREKNIYLQAELFTALKGILNEVAAYRKHFGKTIDLKGLLDL